MKYYVIYKITNTINNKIYIGKHITNNLNDNYMGSGKILLRAIKKYGIMKFKKELLYKFKTKKEMNNMERKIINKEFLSRKDVYNIKYGGNGGWDYVNKLLEHTGKKHSLKTKKKMSIVHRNKKHSLKTRKKMSTLAKKRLREPKNNSMYGKKHSFETKKKISLSLKKYFKNPKANE